MKVYIGYDPKESIAYDVCVYSIVKRSKATIVKLYSKDIPEYSRNLGEPQSTDFTFTRFLVPYLSGFEGYSLFCDCDFLFLEDPHELMKYADPDIAVSVVQHPNYLPNDPKKMDNIDQNTYERKNWSSLMLFNNSHPDLRKLTPDFINQGEYTGLELHQFWWLPDAAIGSIPLDWNCLDGYYHLERPKAIHYTDGGPWFKGKETTQYSRLWGRERAFMQASYR